MLCGNHLNNSMWVTILLRLKRGFHYLTGTSASRNIVNNLARDLIIDPELSQQLKEMSHSAQCNLYAVSTPILPAQQNGVRCNHVGLNGDKMPGKVNRKPVGQRGMSPQALCHHHLRAKKMDPNFRRPLSVPDLRPPPISPPPPLPKEGKCQDILQWNITQELVKGAASWSMKYFQINGEIKTLNTKKFPFTKIL